MCNQSGNSAMKTSKENKYFVDGHLVDCPNRANCVSSEVSGKSCSVAPLEFFGSASEAWQALQEVIINMGGRMEESNDHFLHATFRSNLFRFIDDVTCRLDTENHRIHIRSASRLGYSDFGVNRKRVEKIRQIYSP